MFRPTFIVHRGCRILRIDYSGMPIAEAAAAMERAQAVIASEPQHSVRALTIWDTPLSQSSAEMVRRHVAMNTPFIYASAVVTARRVQDVFFESLNVAGRARLTIFEDEEQAKDWLAEQ
jgi:hypothetical protein